MTRDYMKSATSKNYTVWDIHFVSYDRGVKRELEKTFRRSARRKDKNSLKKFLTN